MLTGRSELLKATVATMNYLIAAANLLRRLKMSDDRMDEFIDEFLLRFKKATGFDFKTGKLCASTVPPRGEPLIQGYTAEQWQEIIDGGYLCEFRSSIKEGWFLDTLRNVHEENGVFESGNYSDWPICRPAQLKGVMRPIFVEPVDKDIKCCFFNSHSDILGSLQWCDMRIFSKTELATKYIEV